MPTKKKPKPAPDPLQTRRDAEVPSLPDDHKPLEQ